MTPLEWIAAGILDFVCSLAAFATWTHFDMDGWWEAYHIRRGKSKEQRRPPQP